MLEVSPLWTKKPTISIHLMGEIQYDQSGVSAGCIICVPCVSFLGTSSTVGFLRSKIWSPKCGLNPIGQTSLIHSCPLAG